MPGTTTLNKGQEIAFNSWRSKLPVNLQSDHDYDLRGLWKSNPDTKPTADLHFPDTYKLQNHPTFSDQSIYHSKETPGGTWVNGPFGSNSFIPSLTNLQNKDVNIVDYFKNYEPGNKLLSPISANQEQLANGGYKNNNMKKDKIDPKLMALAVKVAKHMQMMKDSDEMANGGQLRHQMNLGGDIGAGVAGAASGLAGTLLPGPIGSLAQAGIGSIYGALDPNQSKQEKMIAGYGQAAGSIAGGVINPAAIPQAIAVGAQGLGQGLENTNGVNPNIGRMIGGAGQIGGSLMGAGMMANGGMLQEYNAGGTHEQNPMGGIPVGSNASVEEGETKAKLMDGEFIFSDRIKQGGKSKGKSYADLSKAIKNKFKDRENDTAAKRAMNQQLETLAQEQEAVKATKMAKMQSSMDALGMTGEGAMMAMGGVLKAYSHGGRIQYSGGGRVSSKFKGSYATGLNNDNLKAYQDYVIGQDASALGKSGADNVYGNNTHTSTGKYLQGFLNSQQQVPQTVPQDITPDNYIGDGSTPEYRPKPNNLVGSVVAGAEAGAQGGIEEGALPNMPGETPWMDIAGTTANMAGDFYNLAQGIRGPENITLDRLNPELLDLSRQRQIARNNAASSLAVNRENVRAAAPSSGGVLSGTIAGTAAIHGALGNQLSESAQNEAVSNVGIKNAAQQGNVELANKELQLNLQAKAKAQEAIQAGLMGVGAKTAIGIKDYKQEGIQKEQNERILNTLSTISTDFRANKDGTYTFKDSDGVSKTVSAEEGNKLAYEQEIKKMKLKFNIKD